MEPNTQEQPILTTEVSKLSQKDAVYNFVVEVLNGSPGYSQVLLKEVKLKDLVTKEVRKIVRQRLFAAVKSGEVKLSKQFEDSKLKKYCSGLINNWLKKDSRFN